MSLGERLAEAAVAVVIAVVFGAAGGLLAALIWRAVS